MISVSHQAVVLKCTQCGVNRDFLNCSHIAADLGLEYH
jgi:hypothetical protein